jgi:hypothetical protein
MSLPSINLNITFFQASLNQLRCRYSALSSHRRHPPLSSEPSQSPRRRDHVLTLYGRSPRLHTANSPPSASSIQRLHTNHIRCLMLSRLLHEIPASQTPQLQAQSPKSTIGDHRDRQASMVPLRRVTSKRAPASAFRKERLRNQSLSLHRTLLRRQLPKRSHAAASSRHERLPCL